MTLSPLEKAQVLRKYLGSLPGEDFVNEIVAFHATEARLTPDVVGVVEMLEEPEKYLELLDATMNRIAVKKLLKGAV